MPHNLYVSGLINYKKRSETGSNFLLVRITSTSSKGKRTYFIWKVTGQKMMERIENLATGTVIGLFGAELGPCYKTVDGTYLPFIESVTDIVCPMLQSTTAKSGSEKIESISDEEAGALA